MAAPCRNFSQKSLQEISVFCPDCDVCIRTEPDKKSLCQVKGVVYSAVCVLCDHEHSQDPNSKHNGRYVGETARTLSERTSEHSAALRRYVSGSFMFKHWALYHSDLLETPKFKFKVVKHHKDPSGRMIHEAVKIHEEASMNSRSE